MQEVEGKDREEQVEVEREKRGGAPMDDCGDGCEMTQDLSQMRSETTSNAKDVHAQRTVCTTQLSVCLIAHVVVSELSLLFCIKFILKIIPRIIGPITDLQVSRSISAGSTVAVMFQMKNATYGFS